MTSSKSEQTRPRRRTSKEASRNSFLASCVVLQNESPRQFHKALSTLVERLQPKDDLELCLVEELAACLWRLRRAWVMETAAMNRALEDHSGAASEPERLADAFRSLANTDRGIRALGIYEARLQRSYERILRSLKTVRETNFPADPLPELDIKAMKSML